MRTALCSVILCKRGLSSMRVGGSDRTGSGTGWERVRGCVVVMPCTASARVLVLAVSKGSGRAATGAAAGAATTACMLAVFPESPGCVPALAVSSGPWPGPSRYSSSPEVRSGPRQIAGVSDISCTAPGARGPMSDGLSGARSPAERSSKAASSVVFCESRTEKQTDCQSDVTSLK